jgi:hypothetical protein
MPVVLMDPLVLFDEASSDPLPEDEQEVAASSTATAAKTRVRRVVAGRRKCRSTGS